VGKLLVVTVGMQILRIRLFSQHTVVTGLTFLSISEWNFSSEQVHIITLGFSLSQVMACDHNYITTFTLFSNVIIIIIIIIAVVATTTAFDNAG
jgi:hypothetical protein